MMDIRHKQLAYVLLRMALGVNFLGHGVFRILSGVRQFAGTTVEHLVRSPLPHGLSLAFAFAIPYIEVALGLGLLLGLLTEVTLTLGGVFMMMLTVGVTSNQQWDIAGQQLVYSLIFFALLFVAEYNAFAMDDVLLRHFPAMWRLQTARPRRATIEGDGRDGIEQAAGASSRP